MATAQQDTPGTALAPAQQSDIEQIRQQGAYQVQRAKEVNLIARRMEGLVWGNVNGAQLSPQTRHLIAEFCLTVGANELTHIDILGNRPFLNVRFYEDLVNQHEHFIGYEQHNISFGACKELRAKAKEARESSKDALADAEALNDETLKVTAAAILREAYEYEAKARRFDLARAHYGAPDDEKSEVYETIMRRWSPLAPIDRIRDGNVIEIGQWIQVVAECNWAGAKDKDPVGNAHPGLTARSRSFRRAAQKAFSAYMEPKLKAVERAEKMIEAEFTIIRSENAERQALTAGPQALTSGSGEPTAASAANAQPLPVEDRTTTQPAAAAAQQPPAASPASTVTPEELASMSRGYFASLRDAGITDRKPWQAEQGLPESTKDWTGAHFTRALEILTAPFSARVEDGARMLGFNSASEMVAEWKLEEPTTIKGLKELLDTINHELDVRA